MTQEIKSEPILSPADECLIADECARFKKAHGRILAAVKLKSTQLKNDQNEARSLTAQIVASKRDEERQALASAENVAHGLAKLRLKEASALAGLAEQPYFARVVYRERGREVEFRLGVASFPEERIIDWRKGPISRLYYDYEEGDPYDDEIAGQERHGEIVLKRGFRGQHDVLSAIELKHLSLVQSRGRWHRQTKHAQAPFSRKDKEIIRALLASNDDAAYSRLEDTDGYLPQILSLLTPEQFRLISREALKPIIIQGSAGTGKTTVALHRLAWLLFNENSPAREENALVLVYNASLARYVQFVLPGMGIRNVKIASFREWQRDAVEKTHKFPTRLDHLVIDEVQDFTLEELHAVLDTLSDKRGLCLAGDLGQKIIAGRDFGQWEKLLAAIGLENAEVLSLNIAYRSTYQIIEVAEHVRDPLLRDEDLKLVPKFGPEPTLTLCHNAADAAAETKRWIEDVVLLNHHAIAAVVCQNPLETRDLFAALTKLGCRGIRLGSAFDFEFTPGITIATVQDVKGLEFRNLLLFNPSEKNYPANDPVARNLLYVAITRAEHRLDMICHDPPSPLLPDFIVVRDLTAEVETEDRPLFSDVDQDVPNLSPAHEQDEGTVEK